MANRIGEVDGLIDQLDRALFDAKLAAYGVGAVDEEAMLGLSMDCIDTSEAVREVAVSTGDLAVTVRGDHHPAPNDLARRDRAQLADHLRDMFDVDSEGAGMLREIGQSIAQLLDARSKARLKAKSDAQMDAINRRLLARLAAEDDSPETLVRRFNEQQRSQTDELGSISDRVAQREDAARREAVVRETDRDD